MNDRELLWKQYSQNVDLYRFYMELVVKLNVFYYAVTGAILSYYFSHTTMESIHLSLVLPLVMSVAFAGFFIYGALLTSVLRADVFEIRDALQLRAAPDLGVLSVLLYIFAVVFLIVASACGYLLWRA